MHLYWKINSLDIFSNISTTLQSVVSIGSLTTLSALICNNTFMCNNCEVALLKNKNSLQTAIPRILKMFILQNQLSMEANPMHKMYSASGIANFDVLTVCNYWRYTMQWNLLLICENGGPGTYYWWGQTFLLLKIHTNVFEHSSKILTKRIGESDKHTTFLWDMKLSVLNLNFTPLWRGAWA